MTPGELGRPRVRRSADAVDQPDAVLNHERQPKGQQEVVGRRDVVQSPEHGALDENAKQPEQQRSNDEARPKAQAEPLSETVGGEGSQHVHGTVSEVHDAQHSEDDRQPEGKQCVERAVHQPIENLDDQQARHRSPRPSLGLSGVPTCPSCKRDSESGMNA